MSSSLSRFATTLSPHKFQIGPRLRGTQNNKFASSDWNPATPGKNCFFLRFRGLRHWGFHLPCVSYSPGRGKLAPIFPSHLGSLEIAPPFHAFSRNSCFHSELELPSKEAKKDPHNPPVPSRSNVFLPMPKITIDRFFHRWKYMYPLRNGYRSLPVGKDTQPKFKRTSILGDIFFAPTVSCLMLIRFPNPGKYLGYGFEVN